MTIIDKLPGNLVVRNPQMDDLNAVFELLHICDMADLGMTDITLEDMQIYWQEPNFNLATDAWSVYTPEGQLVGYGDIEHREHVRIYFFIRVHPAYRGQGIEKHLLPLIEARAQQHIPEAVSHARITLSSWLNHADTTSAQLFEQVGYKLVRNHWRMEVDLDTAPPVPQWPDGIRVQTLIPGQGERATFEMTEEAFQDHWGHLPMNFDDWARQWFKREGFDPTLWFLAFDGDELAGGSLCIYDKDLASGWVGQLAVRRPWRRHGLAMALLLHTFGEFYRRGIYKIGLGVDAQNLTGATRLYKQAGMRIALQHDTYQKELRAGEELSTQSISV